MTETYEIVVRGRVQGVWFRGFTVDAANQLEIDGWVRNAEDGSVQLLAKGTTDKIKQLESELWIGPPAARVRSVSTKLSNLQVVNLGFTVKY